MTEPVTYVLRAPYFISSRLMPAVTVADTTIHMQAVGIDRDEPDDPRVRWEYIIESTSVMHAGRDLTTPYHGTAAIAGQLPTAMSTLLAHLDHLADADPNPDSSIPREVVDWARRHRDDLAAIIDLDTSDDRMPASAVWRAITHSPDQTPYGRWCAGQATQRADRMATLAPRHGTAHGLVARDELWHEQALAFYTALTNNPPPDDANTPVCVVAGRDSIRAWLDGPAPQTPAVSMAEYLRVRDAGLDWQRIPDLIEAAQHAGLFGVREHTIRAHVVFDETQYAVAHLLTITTPDGHNLASTPIAGDRLDRGGGVLAVVDLLHRYAGHIHDTLATPIPQPAGPAGHARPFPRIQATQPSTPDTTVTAPLPDAPSRAR